MHGIRPDYAAFLTAREQIGSRDGFDPIFMPSFLRDFQASLVEWAVQMGRSAIFADCGLGKTLMELAWAENVTRHTNKRTLVLAPLAVARQTAREAERFGFSAILSRDGTLSPGIVITNYEKLHFFNPSDFAGVVCDESSILKSFDGTRRQQITDFMRKIRFRLLATATAAPNEYVELGTSSEALGYLGHMDMLSRFFKNDQGNSIKPHRDFHKNGRQLDDNAKWRFKGHAEKPFWRWVCSWARAVRRPSDLGFCDDGYILPALIEHQHQVQHETKPDGMLFALPAVGLPEQREERRRTIAERCEMAAHLANNSIDASAVWCQLNQEGDTLERLIKDSVQVSGSDDDDAKEDKIMAFLDGRAKVLVTKARIAGWGMNFQHCAHSISFPTHSYEEYYQTIRRFWRFGQTRQVRADMVVTEGERSVLANLQRKAHAADKMFADLVEHMNEAAAVRRTVSFTKQQEVPSWL